MAPTLPSLDACSAQPPSVRDLIACRASLETPDQDENTPLLLATKHNSVADVTLLLDYYANVEACNRQGCNALMLAAMNSSDRSGPLIDQLIRAKAKINKKNEQGKTPLMVAAYHSNHATVKKLLSAKANVNLSDKHGQTALSLAAHHGSTRVVKILLSAKANVKAKDMQGKTALYWAVQFGDESCVSVLRAAGAKD